MPSSGPAHARAVATAKGRRVGGPVTVGPAKLAWAAHLRDTGSAIAEIVAKTGESETFWGRQAGARSTCRSVLAA